ncbi:MAG TPA: TIM44-like domain-containing protein [Noviherbaspirillum sp.]
MKKYLLTLMIAVGSLSLVVSDADARRMGGGGSFGKQSSMARQSAPAQQAAPSQSRQAQPANATNGAAAANAAKPSMWKGLLGGALLGLGLGALLSHLGIGGALASMISTMLMVALFAAAAFFIYRMLTRKNAPAARNGLQPAYATGNGAGVPEIGSRIEPLNPPAAPAAFQADNAAAGTAAEAMSATLPADFDVPGFVRNAKTYFIRLQAAWDAANVNDIREFTTPEMFAELRMQLQERGGAANHTDVVQLDADVLGLETVGNDYLVSVRFTGLIKEDEQSAAQPFTEVWNLSKSVSGNGGWLLAGIQQVQ